MQVAEAVADVLAGLGADTVFGVVGSGNFHVTNALTARGARFIAARHECGAATMADAWARTSGRTPLLVAAPGSRVHECAHRDHRSGQKPHSPAGPRRRRGRRSGAIQFPHRHGRAGRGRRGGARTGRFGLIGGRRHHPGLPHGDPGAADGGARAAPRRTGRGVAGGDGVRIRGRPGRCSGWIAALEHPCRERCQQRAGGASTCRRGRAGTRGCAAAGRAPGVHRGPRRPRRPGTRGPRAAR